MPNYVTKAEAHAAADRVDADGKKPSATNVRETIGRGSNSTIAEHLKTWRPRDQRLELPPVPEALTSTVSALTSDLWHMVRMFASEETARQIAQASADTVEAQAVAAEVGDRADRLACELESGLARVAQLEQLVAERDHQAGEYTKCLHQLQIDDARKGAEIETLRRALRELAPTGPELRVLAKQARAKGADEALPAA